MNVSRFFPKGGGYKSRLFKLTGPIFIENLLIMLLGVVDTLMLSRYADSSVAAVGVSNQLLMMVFLLFNITTTGTTVLCSLYFGAKDNKSFIQVMGVSVLFNATVGLLISGSLFFFGEDMLRLMNIRPELLSDATIYMRTVGGFAFFQAISQTISAVLRAANKPNYAMQVTLFINILNVFGNYSLIFGHFGFPALGVHGAAISTSVCRGVAMTLLFIVLFKRLIKRLPLDYFRPFPFAKLKASLKIGIPAASEQISYDASQVMIVYFVNILGTEALAARVYVVNIVIVTYLFSLSLAQSAGICAGNLLGMGKKKATYLLTMYALRRSLIVTGCASLLILLFSRSLLSQFTQNETIIVLGIGALAVDLILEQGRAAVLLFIMTLRSAGDVIFPVIIGLFSMWFFAGFCGYTFGILFGWGLAGMWIGFALDECSRGTLLYYRWKSQKWKKRTLIRSNVKID